ncbi:hypothetical protein C0J52_11603 [Blattella germanica]|nr:hypothetical protein C0J52_11603 [Blattella germanica]
MEADQDIDDDTHICLKCRTTITGLDNYVKHRKAGCSASVPTNRNTSTPVNVDVSSSIPKNDSSSPAHEENDPNLKADDFFSSLELQSSAKKTGTSPGASTKNLSGVLTRSRATAAILANTTSREVQQSVKSDSELLGNFSNECPSSSAVTTETAAPPPHFTGGKWKPSLTNQTVISTSQVCRLSHSEEEEDIIQETDSNTRRLPSTNLSRGPPPGHTSGKWVPGKHVRLGEGSGGSGNSGGAGIDNMLLMPPLRKSGSTIQYWCGPCNRRLSSRTLYERHLLSELHFKRTLQERELEEDLGQNELDRGTDKRQVKRTEIYLNSEIWPRSKRKRLISGVSSESPKRQKRQSHSREICCEVCSSKVWPHLLGKHLVSHYHCRKARSGHPEAMRLVLDNIHSVVKQAPFQCSPCKFYCNTMSSFRQHWTSIEHQEIDRQMTGRFWCSICKYECENSVDIEGHLESIMHRELVSVINRSVPIVIRKLCVLNCGTCGMEFRYNIQLRYHGLRTGHQELNTASDEYQERFPCSECHFIGSSCSSLQRHVFHAHKSESSKKGAYFCGACSLNFDTAEESAQHRRSQEHKYTALASRKERGLTEEDLSKSCPHCGGNFDNVLLLKAHLREQHSEFPYRCPRCGMAFTLPQEVSRHVRERACIFPPEELKTVIAPGVKDVFEKDVSATEHLSVDMEDVEEIESTKDIFACNQCPYKTDSKAELLFHEVLHSEPIPGSYTPNEPNSQMARYQCPICTREFRKSALRSHLRTHTDERPFVCSICYRGFGHRSSMIKHVKQTHMAEAGHSCDLCPFKTPNKATLERHRLTHTNRNKPFLCAVCGASFFLK